MAERSARTGFSVSFDFARAVSRERIPRPVLSIVFLTEMGLIGGVKKVSSDRDDGEG
jgi:hypothetical protein